MKKGTVIVLLFILVTWGFTSCDKQSPYLNGVVKVVSMPATTDTLKGRVVELEDIVTGLMAAYDDHLLFFSSKVGDYYIHDYRATDGVKLGAFCRKGGGPDEVQYLSPSKHVFKDDQGINLWFEVNRKTMKVLHLTTSLAEQRTVFDTVQYELDKGKRRGYYYLYFFKHEEGRYLVKNQAVEKSMADIEYEPGAFHLYNSQTNERLKTFILFKKPLINTNNGELFVTKEAYFGSCDALKPDGSKVAMAMLHMGQLNIMDTETGEIKGYRVKGTPDFDYMKEHVSKLVLYHRYIAVDDENIYVSYCDQLAGDGRRPLSSHYVHVFTWKGDFVRRIYFEEPFLNMTVDPITHKLYTYDTYDRVVQYDL